MSTATVTLTHKGWFGLCPVYYAGLDTDAPFVDPRHWLMQPLMWFSEAMYDLFFVVISALTDYPDQGWPLVITGELRIPVQRSYEVGP